MRGRQRAIHLDGGRLSGEIINQVQQPERVSIPHLVRHEVHRPLDPPEDWGRVSRGRTKVGPTHFLELMVELTSTIENTGSSDQRGLAEFFVLLGPELETCVGELVEALEMGSDPRPFWARWIEVVVQRTPPETNEPKKTS